jgi:hypothetical protein
MTDKDKALSLEQTLRLALEALSPDPYRSEWAVEEDKCKAITAIKAALEAKDEPVFHKPYLDIEGPLHVVCRCPACKAQPQRKPLTDEEIQQIFIANSVVVDNGNAYMVAGLRTVNIARAIEAKLKEKNT